MIAKAKKNFCFIVNPIAGNSNNKKFCLDLIEEVKSPFVDIQCVDLKRKGHASEVVAQNLDKENCTIVSVGGDGTFNEIASALVNKDTPIAIVPRGSGNGLARMIKIPERKSEIAKYLLEGQVQAVDAGKVAGQYFFCTCGFGFDAHIASVFNKGKRRGSQRYVQNILKLLLSYNPVEAEFVIDGVEHKGKFFLVTFSNANQYGNNAFIAPAANLSDGMLQATIVHPFPQVLAPLMTTALLGGFIDKMPFVETVSFRQVEIKHVSSSCFHCDGETLEVKYPTTVEVISNAIRLLVPKKYQNKPMRENKKIFPLRRFTSIEI